VGGICAKATDGPMAIHAAANAKPLLLIPVLTMKKKRRGKPRRSSHQL
jgi:hypothetical protein